MFSCLFSLIRIVFMCFSVIYIEYFPYCLFVSNSQVIGCEDRLGNDVYCVGWGVKLYSIQGSSDGMCGRWTTVIAGTVAAAVYCLFI